jgi:O-antigen ligase
MQPLWIVVAVVGVAFFLGEHDWGKSQLVDFAPSDEELVSAVQGGDAWRQLAFLSIGAMGVFLLLPRSGATGILPVLRGADCQSASKIRHVGNLPHGTGETPVAPAIRFDNALALLMLMYLAWCLASIMWSVEPMMSGKRWMVLMLCFLGVLGTSRCLSRQELCSAAMTIMAGYAAIGLLAELSLGTFRPWQAGYRFGGTVHPNAQGVYCAILCLAAVCKIIDPTRRKPLAIGLCAISIVLLLLTKSRAALAGLAAALPVLWLVRARVKTKVLVAGGAVLAVTAALLAATLAGIDVKREATDAVLLGRSDDAESLSGRVPLWSELLTYAAQRPLLGYGYDAFWTPTHIEDVSAFAEWAIHTAHSSYIDVLLSVGVVGAGLALAATATAVGRAAAAYVRSGDPGAAFALGLLVFGLVNASMESTFGQPHCVSFLAACGVGHLAFFPGEVTAPCASST